MRLLALALLFAGLTAAYPGAVPEALEPRSCTKSSYDPTLALDVLSNASLAGCNNACCYIYGCDGYLYCSNSYVRLPSTTKATSTQADDDM